jgi:hypothetical protein
MDGDFAAVRDNADAVRDHSFHCIAGTESSDVRVPILGMWG